ncbi:MAG: hypothetical protein ACI31G_04190 [Bacilli bacterium]
MKFFTKKEKLVDNIVYMAVMAAINVVFVLLTSLSPVLVILIVFVLPLTSTIVTLYCKKRYFLIYAFVTITLCLLVTIYNISDTLFYVIPSLISGFIFGVLLLHKVHSSLIIFISSIIQTILTILSIPLIDVLLHIDIISVFASIVNLNNYKYLDFISYSFIFFLSLTQISLSFIIIKDELVKFDYNVNDNKIKPYVYMLVIVIFSLISLILSFIKEPIADKYIFGPLSYLFMFFGLYFFVYVFIDSFKNKRTFLYIGYIFSFFVFIILFGLFYEKINNPYGLLLIQILFILFDVVAFTNKYLFKKKINIK